MAEQKAKDFNTAAATWDKKPRRVILAHAVAEAISREVPLTAGMNAMEYGCGTGLVSLELAAKVGRITAVDSARGMLDVLERKAQEKQIRNVSTWRVDSSAVILPDELFHLVFSSMVLHHVEDTAKLINLLHSSLDPGGYLAVADLDEEDGSFHDNPGGVPHHGFNRGNLKILFERTGFTHVRSILTHSIRKEREGKIRDYPVFLMVGQRRV